MHPELKAYLYDYHARTMARYDAVDRQSAQMLKILTRVSTPQPACPMGTTIDDGLTENAGVLAVVLNVSSTTTQAQEPAACVHDAPSVCIEMVPITCSTECLTHVTSIASVDELGCVTTSRAISHTGDLEKKWCSKNYRQPWSPPVQVQAPSKGNMLRPCPWPSFDCCPKRTPLQYTWLEPIKTYEISHMGHQAKMVGMLHISPGCRLSCMSSCDSGTDLIEQVVGSAWLAKVFLEPKPC
ncbi:hypothetical protein D1007_05086 [Hordeum vulgare]|nr:hypothetical protein D1007_05086 [Hordeum vulgare]